MKRYGTNRDIARRDVGETIGCKADRQEAKAGRGVSSRRDARVDDAARRRRRADAYGCNTRVSFAALVTALTLLPAAAKADFTITNYGHATGAMAIQGSGPSGVDLTANVQATATSGAADFYDVTGLAGWSDYDLITEYGAKAILGGSADSLAGEMSVQAGAKTSTSKVATLATATAKVAFISDEPFSFELTRTSGARVYSGHDMLYGGAGAPQSNAYTQVNLGSTLEHYELHANTSVGTQQPYGWYEFDHSIYADRPFVGTRAAGSHELSITSSADASPAAPDAPVNYQIEGKSGQHFYTAFHSLTAPLSVSSNGGTIGVLDVGSGTSVTLDDGAGTGVRVGVVNIGPTGQLDIGDGPVVIDYEGTSPLGGVNTAGTIANKIKTGYNSGAWNGYGIISSTAAADTTHKLGIAYGEASAVGITSIGGLAVDSTSVIMGVRYFGDATMDGQVNFDDLIKLSQNYNGTGKVWTDADFNYDGIVNFDDLAPLSQNYEGANPLAPWQDAPALFSAGFKADWALAQSLVPEPTMLGGLGMFGVAALRRRR